MGMMFWFVGSVVLIFLLLAGTFLLIRWFQPSRPEAIKSIASELDWSYKTHENDDQPEFMAIRGTNQLELSHSVSDTFRGIEFHVFEHKYRLTEADDEQGATVAAFPLADDIEPFHVIPDEQARSIPSDQLNQLGPNRVTVKYYDTLSEHYEIRAQDATAVRNQIRDEGFDFLDDPDHDEWRLDVRQGWLNLWITSGNWITKPLPYRDTLGQYLDIAQQFLPLQEPSET